MQGFGLQSIYNSDEDFALNIRLLTALAFVPTDYVRAAYDELMKTEFYCEAGVEEYIEHKDGIDKLVKYFQDTYLFTFDRFGKEKDSLFPPKLWNVYENVLLGNIHSHLKLYLKSDNLFRSL